MISPQLLATLDKLPPNLQAEVLIYAESLAAQCELNSQPEPSARVYRQAGTMKGMFKMADDFDAPLEDFQDYM